MVTVIKNDYTPKYYEFSIDTESELALLPKVGVAGKEYLNTIKECCNGSFAYLSSSALKVWTLNGVTNTWQAIE